MMTCQVSDPRLPGRALSFSLFPALQLWRTVHRSIIDARDTLFLAALLQKITISRTMDALTQFFHMGGYAFYVWTAYAITTVLLILNVYIPIRHAKSQRRRLRRMLSESDVRSQN
jgi:heme exporter protein D